MWQKENSQNMSHRIACGIHGLFTQKNIVTKNSMWHLFGRTILTFLQKANHQQTLEETVKVDCEVLSPKDDGSTIIRSLPMFLPHQILQHLVKVGLKIPPEWIRNYWCHLKSVGNAWATRVNDETLIPNLGFVSSTLTWSYMCLKYIYQNTSNISRD